MADLFQITPPIIRAEGKDVPPEQIQAGFNSLARQTQIGLNSVATDPTGPASGDLSGTYPAPTVVAVHAIGGTLDGVLIGSTTPAAGHFTTVSATTPIPVISGGTGQNALNAHNVIIGEGSSAVGFAAPGTAGQMLISAGAAVDPSFANNPVITGGTVDNVPIGNTTPSSGNFTTITASTPISVSSGGIGVGSLTVHGVLLGEGTAAVSATAAGTTGQMLLGSTGANPLFGNNPTITGGTINGAAIGGTTPAAGSFTAISATGTITPSTTNGIVGTTLADNANAGSVGEFVTATGSGISLTTATTANITSISLTAGDWDVSGNTEFDSSGGAGVTLLQTAVTSTSLANGATGVRSITQVTFTTNGAESAVAPVQRFNLSTTTTIFLTGAATFSAGTVTATGIIRARRIR